MKFKNSYYVEQSHKGAVTSDILLQKKCGCIHGLKTMDVSIDFFVAELTMWESDGGRSPTVTSVSDLG